MYDSPNPRLERKYLQARHDREPFTAERRNHTWLLPRVITDQDVLTVAKRLPHITDFGCVGTPRRPRVFAHSLDGSFDPPWELTERNIAAVRVAADWLIETVPVTPLWEPRDESTDTRRTTYGLKHVLESETGIYVSNGEMILAAELVGVPWAVRMPNPPVGISPDLYYVIRTLAWNRGSRRV